MLIKNTAFVLPDVHQEQYQHLNHISQQSLPNEHTKIKTCCNIMHGNKNVEDLWYNSIFTWVLFNPTPSSSAGTLKVKTSS